jgi:hypothetical protein
VCGGGSVMWERRTRHLTFIHGVDPFSFGIWSRVSYSIWSRVWWSVLGCAGLCWKGQARRGWVVRTSPRIQIECRNGVWLDWTWKARQTKRVRVGPGWGEMVRESPHEHRGW